MICTSIFALRGHDMEVLVFWMWIETGENVIPSRRFWHNKYRSRGHREQESSYTTYRWFSCEGETVGIMPG